MDPREKVVENGKYDFLKAQWRKAKVDGPPRAAAESYFRIHQSQFRLNNFILGSNFSSQGGPAAKNHLRIHQTKSC